MKKTFIAVIDGEAVMAFRADDEDKANDLVHGEESERGGIKTVLTDYERADGGMIWDGSSDIDVRLATDAEHKQWQQPLDAARADDDVMDVDDDDWNTFLIPISDPLADDDDDDDEHPPAR